MAAAFMDLGKRPDLPLPAMLPLSGRSANATLDPDLTRSGVCLDWTPSGRDLVILGAGGLGLTIFQPHDDGPAALAALLRESAEASPCTCKTSACKAWTPLEGPTSAQPPSMLPS